MKLDIGAIVRQSVLKIQVSLKSYKNNGQFTWKRFHIYDNISLNSLRMRNVSAKACRENQNTHFIFNNVFPKVAPFMRQCRKVYLRPTGYKWLHNMAIRVAYWKSKATCTYAHAHVYVSGYPHARIHARARTHRPICNTYWFSTGTMIRERASVLRCTYVVCCI